MSINKLRASLDLEKNIKSSYDIDKKEVITRRKTDIFSNLDAIEDIQFKENENTLEKESKDYSLNEEKSFSNFVSNLTNIKPKKNGKEKRKPPTPSKGKFERRKLFEDSLSFKNENKDKNKKRNKARSQKAIMNQKKYEFEKNNEKGDVVFGKEINSKEIPDSFLNVPSKLSTLLEKPNLKIISPAKNVPGNYSYYINDVASSLKKFIDFDYDSIFSPENEKNMKYYEYKSMEIEDLPKKKLLIIDLDETIIHSEFRNEDNFEILDSLKKNSKLIIKTFTYTDENFRYYMDVFFRPHLDIFLKEMSNYFDLAIFTASVKGYADTILDFIEKDQKFFKFRLYRNACIPIKQGLFIKDLRIIKNYDPKNVILMDNSLYSFMNQPRNGLLVNSFYNNHNDKQLLSARNFLIDHIYPSLDIREVIEEWFKFTDLLYKGTSKYNKIE